MPAFGVLRPSLTNIAAARGHGMPTRTSLTLPSRHIRVFAERPPLVGLVSRARARRCKLSTGVASLEISKDKLRVAARGCAGVVLVDLIEGLLEDTLRVGPRNDSLVDERAPQTTGGVGQHP